MVRKALIKGCFVTGKTPKFNVCAATLKIELESCRRRFRTYSGTFWIGAQKKLKKFRDQYGLSIPQYKIEKLTSPNLTFPFDYNLLILPLDEEFKVCPTTFIVKILKPRGTSVY